MCFAFPENIGYLLLLGPLAVLLGYGVIRELHIRSAVVAVPVADAMMPRMQLWRVILKKFALFFGIASLLIALTGPSLCSGEKPVLRSGADLLFVLDVSRSMRAKDVLPDRLGQAKQEIIRISHDVRGGRRATLLFAGAPLVQCPLTTDQAAFDALLGMASPELIEEQGTAFRPALELAAALLRPASEVRGTSETKGEKIVVLLSDGEDHAGDLRSAAFQLQKEGIHLFVIGVGMPQPVVIPSEGGAPKRDERGRVVMSSFRAEPLQALARDTGGAYFRSRAGHTVSREVSEGINRMAAASRWVMEPADREPISNYFLVAASLFLLSETMIGRGSRRVEKS
ncbi:MAG: VWA domain-containing protein [Chlorobium sp.]|nr:MAG: VWA domain-containing protein [Chlorobium sp.]